MAAGRDIPRTRTRSRTFSWLSLHSIGRQGHGSFTLLHCNAHCHMRSYHGCRLVLLPLGLQLDARPDVCGHEGHDVVHRALLHVHAGRARQHLPHSSVLGRISIHTFPHLAASCGKATTEACRLRSRAGAAGVNRQNILHNGLAHGVRLGAC